MINSVFKKILSSRSIRKSQRKSKTNRNFQQTRRHLAGASYESLEQRALMAVLTIGQPVYETIGTVGDQDQFEFTLQNSTKLAMDALDTIDRPEGDGVVWTLEGPSGVVVLNRPLGSDLSAQWISYGQDRALNLIPGNYHLTLNGVSDAQGAYAFRLLDLNNAAPLTATLTTAALSPASEADIYKFDVIAGNRFTIDTNSTSPASAVWNLLDPLGRPVEGNNLGFDLTNKLLTMTGTYTLLVEGYSLDVGQIDYTVGATLTGNSSLPDLNVGVALTLGGIRTSTLATSTETDRLTFTLTEPKRVYFDTLKAEDGMQWTLEGPAGIEVQSRNFYEEWQYSNTSNVLDLIPGTYQIRINSPAGVTGTYSFRVLDLGTATDLTLGTVRTGTLANTISGVQVASRTDTYKFNVNEGERFYFDSNVPNAQNAYWRVLDPLGRTVPFLQGYLGSDLESTPLTFAGTYTLLVEGYSYDLGSVNYSFNVQKVPSELPVPLSLDATTTSALTVPGQQVHYSFTIASPTPVYMDALQTSSGLNWSLKGPTGAFVTSQTLDNEWYYGAANYLLQPGNYDLTIDGSGDAIGPYAFRLLDLNAASALPLNSVVNGTLATGHETVVYKFDVQANEAYCFDSRSSSIGNATWRLLDPFGNVVPSTAVGLSTDIEPPRFTIPGSYTLVVEGYLYETTPINFSFEAHKIGLPSTQPLTLNQTISAEISLAGEQDVYNFEVTTPKSVSFDAISFAGPLNWTLHGPAGNIVLNSDFANDWLNGEPSVSLIPGSYSLTIDGNGDTTGAYSFRLLNLTDAAPISLNTTITGLLPTGPEAVAYTLNVATPSRYFFDALTADTGNAYWRIIDPLGRSMGNTITSLSADIEPSKFSLPGTYTLLIEGYPSDTQPINYSFRVHEVIDATPTSLVLGNTYTDSIAVKGEQDRYAFNLSAATRVYFDALSSGSNLNWTLQGPAGTYFSNLSIDISNSIYFYGPNSTLDLIPGNYVLTIDGLYDNIGGYSFRLLDLSAAAVNLPVSTTVNGTLSPNDKTNVYTFAATRGQRFTIDTNSADPGNATWTLLDPLARPVPGFSSFLSGDVTNVTLQMTGTYTLLIEGSSSGSPATISYSVAANLLGTGTVTNLNAGTTQTLGTIRSSTIGVEGEVDTYRFVLAAPTSIHFDGLVGDGANWTLIGAEGTLVDQSSFTYDYWGNGTYPLNLLAGSYQLRIAGSVGPYSFRLIDLGLATPLVLDAVTSGTLGNTINGVNVATRTDAFKFTATAGERYYFESRTTANIQFSGWSLFDPLGRPMTGLRNSLNGDMESNPFEMSGTYTLLVEGAWGATGTIPYEFVVHKIAPDTTVPMTLGSLITGSLLSPGEQRHYSFTLPVDSLVAFSGLSAPSGFGFYLLGPGGEVVSNLDFSAGYFNDGSNRFHLPAGEYTVTIDAPADAIGNYSFRLLDLAAATPSTPGDLVTGTLSLANPLVNYKFDANAGDSFYFDSNLTFGTNAFWKLLDPLGRSVPFATNALHGDLEPGPLSLAGTYTLMVQYYYYDTDPIDYAFRVVPVAPAIALPLQPDVITSGQITSVGEQDQYTFTLTEKSLIYFDDLSAADGLYWSLYGPAGYQVFNASLSSDQNAGVLSLMPGEYILNIDGTGDSMGDYAFQLLNLASANPLALSTTINGSLSPAQEVDTYKFTASAGQSFYFNSTSLNTQNALWRLLDPFGNQVAGAQDYLSNDMKINVIPISGTYTLLIEGYFYDTGSIDYSFRVDSIDVKPADTILAPATIPENEAVGFNVGSFTTSDVDETSTQTYALVSGDGSSDNSLFLIVGNQLKSAASFNYESKNSYSVRVRTTDNIGLAFERAYTVSVTDVNEAPTDIALSANSIEENKPSGSTVGTFTTSDPDADNTHTYSLVSGIGADDNASFTIDAAGNLLTAASFDFEAKDAYYVRVRTTDQGLLSTEKTFVVSVLDVNEAPIPQADNYSVMEDVLLNIGDTNDLIDNDLDPEKDLLVVSAINGSAASVGQPITLASGAVLTVQPNGQFVYDQQSAFNHMRAGESNSDSFVYSVTDGEFISEATASITIAGVNDAPVATAQSVSTAEDTPLPIILAGSDVESDALTYTIVSGPSKGTLSGSGANLTYTPNLNANGSDVFTFIVNDGALDSQLATISIHIDPVNDAPTATGQSVSTDEDHQVSILLNAVDVDGDALSYLIVGSPTLGTLSGTAPNLVYTPNLNVSGNDTFSYKVNDGQLDSDTVTVSIAIAAINDAPVGNPQSLNVDADSTLSITLTGSDVDSSGLTYHVMHNPTKGTLTGVAPNLVYTPGMFASGADSFTFVVNDGQIDSSTVTVSITVNAVSYDFGDLANTFGTLLANNGPWHAIRGGLYLGASVTSELNGRPNSGASLDAGDDGVQLPTLIVPNFPAIAYVTASEPGRLDAFIDFNGNGSFDETERITPLGGALLDSGSNAINFFVPATATAGSRGARFRFSSVGGLAPTGPAHDGEVEDYKVTIRIPAVGTPQLLDDPTSAGKKMLFIRGTGGNDNIAVNPVAGGYKVVMNGVTSTLFNPTSQVAVFGLGGDDTIHLDGLLLPSYVDAGAGNDTVHGGNGNDLVFGRAGNDTIFGHGGDDTVYGGTGNDIISSDEGIGYIFGEVGNDQLSGNGILVGGDGNDVIVGSGVRNLIIGGLGADRITGANANEGDILISGPTVFDTDLDSLKLISSEWKQDTNYLVRIANLDGSNSEGANAPAFLNSSTVLYENSIDTITNFGSTLAGRTDWVFLSARDKKVNSSGVVVTIQPPAAARMASFAAFNPDAIYDLNGDSSVSPLDALIVVNLLNQMRSGAKVDPAELTFADVNGDGLVSPLDALLVINRLNQRSTAPVAFIEDEAAVDLLPGETPDGSWASGEGESTDQPEYASRVDALFDAYEDLVRASKRKSV